MSYSRWLNSDFYTYWRAPVLSIKEENILACHYTLDETDYFTYEQCKGYVVSPDDLIWMMGINGEQAEELARYMREFIKDVDKKFNEGEI